jgi:5-methylcytosine-specific restriction endonuclease McrA
LPYAFTRTDWQQCLDYWCGFCCYCAERRATTIDHFIPLDSPDCPGTIPGNVLPACASCNYSKQNRSAGEWLAWKFGADQARETLALIQQYFEWIETQG